MTLMIATWFVADDKEVSTKFAQVRGDSSSWKFQEVYWRCVGVFFQTSKFRNPEARHVFFTNTEIPKIDGVDFKILFSRLDVEVVPLPITFRLKKTVSDSWGNQFYILDIIKYLAQNPRAEANIVLDADCVWAGEASLVRSLIIEKGCLLYTLGHAEHSLEQRINGVTRQEMARLGEEIFPDMPKQDARMGISYNGGEFFAATSEACVAIAKDIDVLWRKRTIGDTSTSGYLEEAHFLSIIYRHQRYEDYSANFFIKRMWTNFTHNNVISGDDHLPIWHLPGEKKTGFARMFHALAYGKMPDNVDEYKRMLRTYFGIPKKTKLKFIRDFAVKLNDRRRR